MKNIRKSQEQFIKEIYDLVGNEYSVLSEYNGNRKKVKIQHVTCGHIWGVKPTLFIHSGTRCPSCKTGIRKIKNHDDFIAEVKIKHADKYEVTTRYTGMRDAITIKCIKHGESITKPQTFLKHGCHSCCMDGRSKTHEEFVFKLKQVHPNIIPMETYIRSSKSILFKCDCNYEWKTTPSNILKKFGCPSCESPTSAGEKSIEKYLNDNNFKYIKQYTNEQCKNVKILRFDFYVENKILIEFDGKQHFTPIDFGGRGIEWAEKDYKDRNKSDQIKNTFCLSNDIPLIRIPFYTQEIDKILSNVFRYLGFGNCMNVDKTYIYRFLVNHRKWDKNNYYDQANDFIKTK